MISLRHLGSSPSPKISPFVRLSIRATTPRREQEIPPCLRVSVASGLAPRFGASPQMELRPCERRSLRPTELRRELSIGQKSLLDDAGPHRHQVADDRAVGRLATGGMSTLMPCCASRVNGFVRVGGLDRHRRVRRAEAVRRAPAPAPGGCAGTPIQTPRRLLLRRRHPVALEERHRVIAPERRRRVVDLAGCPSGPARSRSARSPGSRRPRRCRTSTGRTGPCRS